MTLPDVERKELARAKALLERRSLLVTLTQWLGKPIEGGIGMLPESAQVRIGEITGRSLSRALDVALTTLDAGHAGKRARETRHKLATAATGAVGGLFGLAGLAVELPITTVLMLRSIADVARSEGFDLSDPEVRIACVQVFALGGPSSDDDAAETGYYAVRAGLASLVRDAAARVAAQGARAGTSGVVVRFLERVAARFGIVVQDKVLLEALPVVGAAGGALVNTVFTGHFQDLARGHFTLLRLERTHGLDAVRDEYRFLAASEVDADVEPSP